MKRCTRSVSPSVRLSRAFDFLEIIKNVEISNLTEISTSVTGGGGLIDVKQSKLKVTRN